MKKIFSMRLEKGRIYAINAKRKWMFLTKLQKKIYITLKHNVEEG